MPFVFYDTETTGTNLFFDQILQFAAILTDDNLAETGRFEVRCRLQPHILANPGAMNVTNVPVDQLHDPTLPSHYEMILQIRHKLLSWEPAQFIGHNSIKFDEGLLRSAFYQNLLPPYLTNTNGNSRLDTLPMAQAASIFEPEALNVPLGPKGKPSFKLDLLAPANGFNHANAHEAMSDVEATIFICRKIRDRAPDTWSRFMQFSQRAAVIDFCEAEELFGLTEFYYGNPHTFVLHTLGRNSDDPNEIVAFHLGFDPQEIAAYSDGQLQEFAKQSPKPLRRFRANALPSLSYADEAHPVSRSSEISYNVLASRAAYLVDNPELKSRLVDACIATKTEYDESPHVEENIYLGFASDDDSSLMLEFHGANWSDRYDIVGKFNDLRYRELGERVIYTESPQHLPLERQRYWELKFTQRLLGDDDTCDALTITDAIQQADELLANSSGDKSELIAGHRVELIKRHEALKLVVG